MIIIIEGTDKTGKTTFINTFAKQHKCIIIKNQHKPNGINDKQLKESYIALLYFINKYHNKFDIILDRFYPSQLVYSILRGHDSFDDSWYNNFEQKLRKFGHLYVYCTVDKETLLERHKIEQDEYLKTNNIDLIQKRYDKFYNQTNLNKVQLNITPDKSFFQSLVKLEVLTNLQTLRR